MELENSRKRNTTSNIIKLFFCMCFVFVEFLFKNNINAATYGIFKYEEINNGTEIRITGCDKNATGTLNIPSTIDGKPVTSIGNWAFWNCSGFTGNLVIPESVTSIGSHAFGYCSGFTGNLVIPENVTSIGNYAFNNGSGFNGKLVIPNSVKNIGDDAFSVCSGLTGNLVIPDGVTSIGDSAFSGCSGFTGDLVIPNSVTSIGDNAFRRCKGFTGNLVISNSVTSIGDSAFMNCNGFTGNLVIPESVTSIGNSAFYYCSGFTGNLVISDSVTNIENNAFIGCSGFTGNLTIPNSVISIGNSAFSFCSGFTGNLVIPNSVTSIGDYAFYECSKIKSVVFYANSPEMGKYSFERSSFPIYYRKGTTGFTVDNNYDVSRLVPYELKLINSSIKITDFSNSEYVELADEYGFIRDLVKKITYTSDDENIATVEAGGRIIAKGNGKTKVNAIVSMGNSTKVILNENVDVDIPLVTSISLDKEKLEFYFTIPQKIKATVLPDNAVRKTLNWTSSDDSVAVVDQNGVVRAISNGNAIITCTTTDGSNISKSVNVTVSDIPKGFSNKGDVNNDGKVDLVDVFLVYNYYLKNSGNTSINASELAKADLNGDKKIDLLDVYLTYNIYLKRTSGLPLTYQVGEGGTISDSSRTVVVGEMCKVSATPNTGYKFVGWYVNNKLISTDSTIEFTMPNSNTTIEAKFAKM